MYNIQRTLKHRYNSPRFLLKIETIEEDISSAKQSKDDSPQPPPSTPTKAQNRPSPSSMVTPKAVRSGLARSPETMGSKKNLSPSDTIEIEDENKIGSNVEDKTLTRSKPAKSPLTLKSPNGSQLKSPENRTPKSPVSPRISNTSELKDSEEKPHKLSSSSRSSSPQKELKNTEEKITKSPTSRSPKHALKSPEKSNAGMARKESPKELRLPKLAPSPTPQETTAPPEINAKINLPKLTERIVH
ncbi:uncharacterized protein LOC143428209 [Xylocopa sonorina]|uniref:uncharacterized protein LOC143428209 n=1 Tax=Xylocopa sonorina TaxID=1818115 RepID=UPI00403AA535